MDNTELIWALRSAAATTGLDAYIKLMQRAADALSAIRPIAAPVTDDEIDAAFDALGLIRESTTVEEVRQALEGFATSRVSALTAERDALKVDAGRYRKVRRGQHWSVINGIGDTLRSEQLDANIDAVMTEET